MANTISYIGNIYRRKKDYYRALIYNFKALSLYEEENNKSGIATVLYRIGVIYYNKKNYNKSVEYLEKSYSINNELKKKRENANVLSYLARNYMDFPTLPPLNGETEKGYKIAEKYFKRAIEISDSIGAKNIVYENVQLLSQLYEMLADKMEKGNKISGFESASILRKKALDELKKYILIKDSINLAEQRNNKKNMEVQFEFEKKVAAEKSMNEKKQMKMLQEQKMLKIFIYLSIGIILLIVFFSYMIYKSWKKTQRQKMIIETAHHEIEKQKNMLEEKNKDITDSIHYASRIQQALITGENYLSKFTSNYFIFFKPRDIVSGDFYWVSAIKENNDANDKILILTGDCTGHGVPGAFMSLLNISLLNQVVIERKITRPDLILNEIRSSVIKILNPNSESIDKKDGMDCVLFSIDIKNQTLQAACANNSFCIIRNEHLIEVEPDKIPVGYSHDNHRAFNLHELNLEKGDMLFTYTDGYADQFGGPNGKKFKNKNLKQLFLSLSNKSVFEQKKEINHVFDTWKGNLDQVDDVLVIGIRI
jgi:serine phosphatase RsbU (regulator of sigma subunit)